MPSTQKHRKSKKNRKSKPVESKTENDFQKLSRMNAIVVTKPEELLSKQLKNEVQKNY